VTPPILHLSEAGEGTATYLGHFTATSATIVDLRTSAGEGTFDFTASNGDLLRTTTAGGETSFTPPNISHVTLTATIVGGTGRFADATGTLTLTFDQTIDQATSTASTAGTIEGRINLNK